MAIKQTTPSGDIDRYIDDFIKKAESSIIASFQYIGEQCVIEARTNGSYKDHTGNLRSSIGYIVLQDGKIYQYGGFGTKEGGNEGYGFAQSISVNYPTGIVLIVVAGMKYAAAVEAKNFNVLTSAELTADKIVPQILGQLGFKIK